MKGANAEVEIYPGTHHGFAFPKRPVYDRDAAERHWERLLALYRRNLCLRPTKALMPFLLIDFPSRSTRSRSRSARSRSAGMRWPISAASCFGWIYARSLLKNERLWGGPAPISLVQIDDFILWVTLGIILGGRTGYVLFYNLPFFIEHPAEIFKLWEGRHVVPWRLPRLRRRGDVVCPQE